MRIVSWNVNGLRKLRPLDTLFDQLNADILCVQETRVSGKWDDSLERLAFVNGYDSFFSICKEKKGYSGVATFCRKDVATPFDAGEGFRCKAGGASISANEDGSFGRCDFENCPCENKGCSAEALSLIEHEGRCVITDHALFVLINVYIPAVSVEGRSAFKMQFLHGLHAKIEALRAKSRNVVVVGDFNICPTTQDCAERIPRMLREEWEMRPSRRWLRRLLSPTGSDFVDSFRAMHPLRTDAFTCWSEATRARENNHGVRIDFIVMNRQLNTTAVCKANIEAHVVGSDHCPVTISMRDTEFTTQVPKNPPPFCTKFMRRFSVRQKSLMDLFLKKKKSRNKPQSSGPVKGSIQCKGSAKLVPVRKTPALRLGVAPRRQIQKTSSKPQNRRAVVAARLVSTTTSEYVSGKNDNPSTSSSKQVDVVSGKAESVRRKDTAREWRKILKGPPPLPLCKHGKKCVLKTVKKAGENKGKTFFSCSYPAGVGLNANCNFFQWAPFKADKGVLPY